MHPKKQMKSCLIVTYGPVPTPQYQTVEGGGMRAWGLAKGLQKNNVEVTVAVNTSFPQELAEHEGVQLVNWSLDESFKNLINSFDAVLVSYCMGDPSVFIADNIEHHRQLILDVYVPIYVEVSARESEEKAQEYKNYFADLERHNHVLKRGDYFLCASQTQKIFYTGVLSSLGLVNPRSYRENRILIAPFGIHNTPATPTDNPYNDLGIDKKKDKTILWFGGLYPWFRIEEFLETIKQLSRKDPSYKFVIVGGKNPFNGNPDFTKQYERAYTFADKESLLNKNLFFVDWVDYDLRINWYKNADFIISINQPGEENGFSWRTRVMDYVWGEAAILTNGGDPLSEQLLEHNAALKLKDLSTASMVAAIEDNYKDTKKLARVKDNIIKIRPTYFWENITLDISKLISASTHPFSDELDFKKDIGFKHHELHAPATQSPQRVYFARTIKAVRLARKTASYAKRKGLKQSAKLAVTTAKNQAKKRTLPKSKQYVFISHPIDNSGAPLVLMNMVQDIVRSNPSIRKNIRVIAPVVLEQQKRVLQKTGVKVEKSVHGLNAPLTGLQLSLKKDDFVLMNTAAIFYNYRNYVFNLLNANRLKHAYWFIHEDIAQMNVVAPELLKKEYVSKIHQLVESGKLTIIVPSKRVKDDYDKVFKTQKVRPIDLRIEVDEAYQKTKQPQDYSKLTFLLSGNASDGRKGHLIALAALQEFVLKYQAVAPQKYRDFSVNFVGVNDDYVSSQIESIGKAILGDRLSIEPSINREKALEIASQSNVVVCCSLNETFALYVAEGMAMGHIVLRNDTAGIEEQLVDGKNGFFIDSDDIHQFASAIEKLLNKDLSDAQLQKMGLTSQKLASRFITQDYSKVIDIN